MAGGFHGSRRPGRPLEHRGSDPSTYDPQTDPQRPWEHPPAPPGPRLLPKDAHVEVDTVDGWAQGLVLEMERVPTGWRCHVAYLHHESGGVTLLEAWVPASQVRPRTT